MPFDPGQLILCALWPAIAVPVIGLLLAMRGGIDWRARFGPPNWTFQSYATNVAVGGSLVTAALAALTIADAKQKTIYTLLVLAINAIAATAPVIFVAWYSIEQTPSGPPATRGYLVPFLLAAVCSCWAAFAQLRVLAELVHNLSPGKPTGLLPRTVDAVLVVAGIAIGLYSVRTIMVQTIKPPAAGPPPRVSVQATPAVKTGKLL